MNNIYEVIKIIDTTTGETKTVQVMYRSGARRYYTAGHLPVSIRAFIHQSKNVKEYPVLNLPRKTIHYY